MIGRSTLESRIRIKATVPEMHAYFAKEPCMRFVEIRDARYSSDEIDLMPAAERNKTVFKWFAILRHPAAEKELHSTFTIPGLTKRLDKLKAEQNEF